MRVTFTSSPENSVKIEELKPGEKFKLLFPGSVGQVVYTMTKNPDTRANGIRVLNNESFEVDYLTLDYRVIPLDRKEPEAYTVRADSIALGQCFVRLHSIAPKTVMMRINKQINMSWKSTQQPAVWYSAPPNGSWHIPAAGLPANYVDPGIFVGGVMATDFMTPTTIDCVDIGTGVTSFVLISEQVIPVSATVAAELATQPPVKEDK